MMKKYRLLIVTLTLSMLFTSYNMISGYGLNTQIDKAKNTKIATNSVTPVYATTKTTYANRDIMINYPQLKNLKDTNLTDLINRVIKSEAIKVLKNYDGGINNLTLKVDYNINWMSNNILSIQYIGTEYIKNELNTNNVFYTTNIDINKGTKIRLKDIINIDDSFIKKIKNGKYKAFSNQVDLDKKSKEEINQNTNSELIKYLSNADDISALNELSAFSYFTKDSIGISFGVSHEIGDHAEFEIKYKDMNDNIKVKNTIWKDFSNMLTVLGNKK